MIYPYIKVNSKVTDYLGVTNDRYRFPDGNYMLWKFDLMDLGGNNDDTLRMIGGVGMTSEQVRDEQNGVTTTPLPEAEDERFRLIAAAVEPATEEEPVEESEEEEVTEQEQSEEGDGDE